jgi:DNA-binding NtrC family response regulator
VISATNSDLKKLVNSGRFREDLYFRLNVVNIVVPPLRERREDIELLAHFFLEKFNRERNKHLQFSDKALRQLEDYNFPGNVRELRNIIEDAFVFTEGPLIQPENLSFRTATKLIDREENMVDIKLAKNSHRILHKDAIEAFEKKYFLQLLQDNFWNINEASKKAGLSREWLSKKIKKLGLKNRVI